MKVLITNKYQPQHDEVVYSCETNEEISDVYIENIKRILDLTKNEAGNPECLPKFTMLLQMTFAYCKEAGFKKEQLKELMTQSVTDFGTYRSNYLLVEKKKTKSRKRV